MAFANLAANQMVDEANASTAGFTVIGPKNPSNQCYTKDQALAAYWLISANMSAYAGNQLVPKSVWASGVVGVPYVIAQAGATAAEACGYTNFGATFYSNVSTLVVGSIWYSDQGLTTPVSGGSGANSTWHQVQGSAKAYKVGPTGIIEVITACVSTPTMGPNPIYLGQSSGAPSNNANATISNAPIGTIVPFKISSAVGAVPGCSITTLLRVNGTLIYTGPTYTQQYGNFTDIFNWTSTTNGGITLNYSVQFGGGGNSANGSLTLA